MKKKLSLTEKISLAENNAVDFMHACVTIALHDEYEVGVQRLRKVNLRRDEINEEMLEVMVQPRKSGREQAAAGQAWLVSLLPEGAETEFRVPLGTGAASAAAPDPAGTGRAGRAGLDGGGQPQAGGLPAAGPGGSGKAHPDRAAGPGHAGELGEEAGEMTLKEAMGYRGENADTLAEKIGIRAGEVRRWMGENGMLRISGARMQQLAAALDGGVLITEDGAEFELYGNRGNA